jgi:hypothetical protein
MYTFGPSHRLGNLQVPNWATASNGMVHHDMVSLKGSVNAPALSLFAAQTNQ